MANVSDDAEKMLLDWILGGAAPTRPTVWGLALCVAVPTASSVVSAAEIGTASGYTAQTMPMAAAASPTGIATNGTAATFGPFSTACTISGMILKNTIATAGTSLFYGALATARTVGAGDSVVFAVGQLSISMT